MIFLINLIIYNIYLQQINRHDILNKSNNLQHISTDVSIKYIIQSSLSDISIHTYIYVVFTHYTYTSQTTVHTKTNQRIIFLQSFQLAIRLL